MDNPYTLINISNINLHYGNGAKNALKKENKKYNFKFFYKVGTTYKNCSAGFDDIKTFIDFIKPINKKYYIYEYIFQNYKCVPYFDYEYELDAKPSDQELTTNQININKHIKDVFKEVFKIVLNDDQIIFMQSHGEKPNGKFKVSFHIIITGYYFSSNVECGFVCEKLKELDEYFDPSVYSKDRMMRSVCSAKDWNDNRTLVPVNKNITINDIEKYLITNYVNTYIRLKCPIKIKKEIIKKNHDIKHVNKEINLNDIGLKIEKIVKEEFHEDSYFTRSVVKHDNITFYGFNYTNRKEKCFTGFTHDKISFYCWLDTQSNIILKCFSANCKGCKKVIGNLNKSNAFNSSINIDNKYLNENNQVKKLIKDFGKTILFKSNMGTGKTELVCDYIDLHKPKRILWISVRQTYASNISQRLSKYKFTNYLDDKADFYTKNRIIVQLESLHHLERNFTIRPFDLIVLDEIESILYHFDSDTIVEKSENTFNLLHLLCKTPNTKIIGMNADLNLRTIEYIKDIDPDFKLVINFNKKKTDIKVQMTDNKDYFINEIKTALTNKKTCCVISLSTKLLYQIEKLLIEWKIKYLMHTRDTDDKFKKELANVNKLWSRYQIILYSPAISVGVDFTKVYFDNVYSIIVPKTASPRIFKQMLGRIRNLKHNNILSYYQHVDINMDSVLYNYNEMIQYFKYCDHEIKVSKQYKLDPDNNIQVVNGFTLYDRIMMHNKIENLNKSTKNFMTQLNILFSDSNYKIEFIDKPVDKKIKIELSDEVYKDKILNAKDIDLDTYNKYSEKVLNNTAMENEKFSIYKYKFKNFWKLKQVTETNLELYFRYEHIYNRLLLLMGKNIDDSDEYIDYQYNKKADIIKNIISTLGFDLKKLDKKILKDDYYENVKTLFKDDNLFKKDYDNIRILFNKDKHILKDNIKGQSLSKLLNGFLNEFGLNINIGRTWKSKDNIKTRITFHQLCVDKKYKL